RLFNPAADRRLAEVHLPTNRRDRPVTPLHQGNDLRLERGRERSPWSATRPLLLHLLPHSNTLLVGLRPHLGCSPVGGKARETQRWIKRAQRYYVPPPVRPPYPGTNEFWEWNNWVGGYVLTAAGKAEVHKGVREEMSWRRERWTGWAPIITALTGLIGTGIGLVALLKRN